MDIMWKKVENEGEIKELAGIANEVWHQHFATILSPEQIDYMVDKFQSERAMTNQIKEDGYEYYFIVADGVKVGYTGIKREQDMLFLSKLYILKRYRGNGYASKTFSFLKQECKKSGLKGIYLTVNRYNDSTIAIYKKTGFQTIRTQVTDIGNGFVMDDYVMELMA
ncbi:MAG: GNAT family N-acetyltransferase [Lachnospiraceae bacterium]|nr:GNAT family N-acetyltransferase [Lachnospiraceae bacterium]